MAGAAAAVDSEKQKRQRVTDRNGKQENTCVTLAGSGEELGGRAGAGTQRTSCLPASRHLLHSESRLLLFPTSAPGLPCCPTFTEHWSSPSDLLCPPDALYKFPSPFLLPALHFLCISHAMNTVLWSRRGYRIHRPLRSHPKNLSAISAPLQSNACQGRPIIGVQSSAQPNTKQAHSQLRS